MPDADRAVAPAILVVGSTMTDLITYAPVLPASGETVVGDSFAIGFGGKGANQAVMCALLGASVGFVGRVGGDYFGAATLENFASFGIDTHGVSTSETAASGAAPIWVDASGENRIIVVPGANGELESSTVAHAVEAARPDVVLTQLEIPESCSMAALEAAREAGSVGVLNPAPMRPVPRELLAAASWLIPNESEFAAIEAALGLEGRGEIDDRAAACASVLETDLVVTLGEAGAVLSRHEGGSSVLIPAPAAAAVDTTGAGDAFVGAFVYALACGAAPRDAVSFGCACAAASVEERGTQTSFPRGERLAALQTGLRSHPSRRDEVAP